MRHAATNGNQHGPYLDDPPRFGINLGPREDTAHELFEAVSEFGRTSLHRLPDGRYVAGVWLEEDCGLNDNYPLMDEVMGELVQLYRIRSRFPSSANTLSTLGSGAIVQETEIIAPDNDAKSLVAKDILGEKRWLQHLADLQAIEDELQRDLAEAPGWSPYAIRNEDEILSWIVKGLIYAPGVGGVYGPDGSLKTFAIIDLALRVADRKSDWADLSIEKTGIVIYLYGEGAGDVEDRTLQAIKYHQMDTTLELLAMPVAPLDVENEVDSLIDRISEAIDVHFGCGKVALVIADTLRTSMRGSVDLDGDVENAYRGMRKIRDKFGSAFLFVHHTGHDQSRYTGSRAIKSNADFLIRISSLPPGDFARRSLLTIEGPSQKLKRGRPAPDVIINASEVEYIDLAGNSQTTLVVDAIQTNHDQEMHPTRSSSVPRSLESRVDRVTALLAQDPNMPQAEIVRETGISKSAVSRICAQIAAETG